MHNNTRNYVVVARFDNKTTDKLNVLRKLLYETGYMASVSEWPPHITIAAYEGDNINLLLTRTKEFSEKHPAFEIMLPSLGILPPGGEHPDTAVLYVSPAQTKKLIDFYYAFHEKLDEYCGKLGWLYSARFGHPVMHSTIGIFKVAQLQKAIEIIFENKIFGITKITALEVYTYPMELIKRFALK
jgi:hypothetical protein